MNSPEATHARPEEYHYDAFISYRQIDIDHAAGI